MAERGFDLSSAAFLFSQETSTINSQWAIYTAATFAAASYGLSSDGVSKAAAGAVATGYAIFALGNWWLIRQAILIKRHLQKDIVAALSNNPDGTFDRSLTYLASTANPLWLVNVGHLLIDCCVMGALWSHIQT